jgi:hypothetical protein
MATVNKNFVIKNGLEVDGNALVVDPTNNRVGINTSTPSYSLHNFGSFATGLNGNALLVSSDSDAITRIGQTIINSAVGTGRINIQDRSGTFSSFYVSTNLIGRLNTIGGLDLTFEVNGTNTLTLTNSANIGIGITNPSNKLQVSGTTWLYPNTTGSSDVVLKLGTFSDSFNSAYDILTDDAVGDDLIIRSNRYSINIRLFRGYTT